MRNPPAGMRIISGSKGCLGRRISPGVWWGMLAGELSGCGAMGRVAASRIFCAIFTSSAFSADANDRQRTRQGEHRHQGNDGEQILSFARQHDRRVSRLDGVIVCLTGREISGPGSHCTGVRCISLRPRVRGPA